MWGGNIPFSYGINSRTLRTGTGPSYGIALAYNIQERAEGGLGATVRRRLVRWAAADGTDPPPVTPTTPRLRPGCHLVQE